MDMGPFPLFPLMLVSTFVVKKYRYSILHFRKRREKKKKKINSLFSLFKLPSLHREEKKMRWQAWDR